MNNEDTKLQINPEFENMIPELTDDELSQLEENILVEGRIVNPIVVWNGVIVDGHNRYKIAQKHPHIQFTVHEKEFESEQEAQIWICSNQLGRRNLTEQHKKYLWGKRYNLECDRAKFHGNQYTRSDESGEGGNRPDQNSHGTRSRIADELGVSEWQVRSSAEFSKGVDAAEEVMPGIKNKILTGTVEASYKDVVAIGKMPPQKRAEAVEELVKPRPKPSGNLNSEDIYPLPQQPKEDKTRDPFVTENAIGSIEGCVDIFISTINTIFGHFPLLKEVPKYRQSVIEIMLGLREYTKIVEEELK